MKIRAVELATLWLPIIGVGIFLSFAGNALYAGHRTHALWLGFCGTVCLLLLGALQLQKVIWDSEKTEPPLSPVERPWVAIGGITPVSDLLYDEKGWDAGVRWHVTVRYELRNTGRTPAIGVEVWANMVPFMLSVFPPGRIENGAPKGPAEPGTDVDAELAKLCEGAKGMKGSGLPPLSAITLHPDRPVHDFVTFNGSPQLFDEAKDALGYSGNLVLVFCVTYKFTSGTDWHQTASAYAMFRPNTKIDLKSGETVPANGLRIVPQPMSNGITT